MKFFYLLSLTLLLLSSVQASTEVESEDLTLQDLEVMSLEELMNITIVSSTGRNQKLSQAPSIASVVTAEQIEHSSARTLSEVLAMVPGLNVYISPLDIQKKSYDIRGIRTALNAQILTLINGVSIDRVNGGSSLQRFELPASAIQRVEVIRGPGSAVYGADAFAGIINIITKDARYLQEHSQAGVRYGSFDRAEVYGNYGEVYESGVELGLNLSYMTSNGDRDRIIKSDLQTGLDAAFSTSASNAPGAYDDRYNIYNMNLNLSYENFSMNLWAYLSKNNGIGAGVANVLDPQGKNEANEVILDLNYDTHPFRDVKWNNKLALTYMQEKDEFTIFPAGAVLPIGGDGNAFSGVSGGGIVSFPDGYIGQPEAIEKKIAYESTFNIAAYEGQDIRLSMGYSFVQFEAKERKNFGPSVIDGTEGSVDGSLSDVTNTPFVYEPDENRKVYYLSLQDEYHFSKQWQLTAGVRYDYYSDFGSTINPRVGLVWNTTEDLTTKLLYGRAFRAPSFQEMYGQNNPIALGNKDLDPETIDMIELGTRYNPNEKFVSSINLYWYEINDLILGDPFISGIRYANLGRQHGAGVELEASYQLTSRLLVSADYAYRWTDNDISNKAVVGVPKHIGHAMFDWSFLRNWYLNGEVFMVADTSRSEDDTRDKISSYRVVNTSMGYRFSKSIEASIAARNLLDKKYYNPSSANPVNDYPMEGLNLFAELKYHF